MDKIEIRRIIDITKDKITYRDERGDTAAIELEPCANNYETVNNIRHENETSYRCVGVREFAEYAYYELYTVGHTQLYMKLSHSPLKRLVSKTLHWNFH